VPHSLARLEQRQGAVAVMNTINDLYNAKQKMVDQFNTVKAKTDAEANAERRHQANLAAANTRARLQRESQERIAKEKLDNKKPGLPKKGEFQADYISEIIGKRVDVDAASKAAAASDYKVKIKELADKNAELGGAPGLKVEFSNYINKYLSTKVGPTGVFTRTDLDEAYVNLTNEQSFRSLSEKSKVMAKSELDAVMAYLQVKYGNRAPVAEFRAAQTVLNRGNMTASAYNQVLNAQVRDTNDRLLGLGFKPQDILKIDNFFMKNREQLDLLQVGGQQEETQQSEIDSVTGLPRTNENGWVLHDDTKGGYAYINPDNPREYIEVE
jgi:6-pyruvoyl-tetrahydropterin synthase